MCGIAGFVHTGASGGVLAPRLAAMLAPIRHRGPDDEGVWVDEQYGVGLGHRRLSILELSPAGHQPMASACGRFVIVFNGEIYNHLDLRKDLEKSGDAPRAGWRGHSDTETLLTCFAAWGVQRALRGAVGMFALAVWDKQENALTLARDRIGEKPLYCGWQGEAFLFASELKALRVHPAFRNEVDWHAASTFLRLNYIPAPSSIYRGIVKLEPGAFSKLTQAYIHQRMLPTPVKYWSLGDAARRGVENPFAGSLGEAADELELLVRQAVKLQSVADVPVGAFLSGGIDSSVVVAMMQSATTSKVTTFSIGMPDAEMDESPHAAAVAGHLGTHHVEHPIQAQEALALIPQLPDIWDEPFADSSQIPTYLISRLARQQVTVALSGDGGDEFFWGYSHYAFYQKVWRARHLGNLPWNAAFAAISMLPRSERVQSILRRSRTVVRLWRQPDAQSLSRYWMDRYRQSPVPLVEQRGVEMIDLPLLPSAPATAALWDAGTYLPDDILVKVDRAAMANSLETRAPLLDHRIVEFSYRLPFEHKMEAGRGKRVLREVLWRHVPYRLVERPKMGFSIPLGSWLKNELRSWTESMLAQIPRDSTVFDKKAVDELWSDHLSGKRVNTEQLWGLLSLLAWFAKQKTSPA
jgi:asparagine synthase (glutamine-hydrolysing)